MSRSRPTAEYYLVVKQFLNRFIYGNDVTVAEQRIYKSDGEFRYHTYKDGKDVNVAMLTDHFYHTPIDRGSYLQGSLAVLPLFKGQVLRFVCIDMDKPELLAKAASALVPVLEKYGLEYMIEYGGEEKSGSYDRGHLWIPVQATAATVGRLFYQIFAEANCKIGKAEFDEVFGVNKNSNVIRVPLGAHLKRNNKVYPVEVNGELTTDPLEFMKAYLALKQPTEEELQALIDPSFVLETDVRDHAPTYRRNLGEFVYEDRGLPVDPDLPPMLRPVVRNCQAINQVIREVKEDRMIDRTGDAHHKAGFWLQAIAFYNDAKLSQKYKASISSGERWFNSLKEKFRTRDAESHYWDYSKKKIFDNPERAFPSCAKWNEKFDMCQGCPFLNNIRTPKSFIYGKPLNREAVGSVSLRTFDEVQSTTMVDFKDHVRDKVYKGEKDDILLCTFQGSGKSVAITDLTSELARKGYKVLIVTPLVELAIEQLKRLRKAGIDPFLLTSHRSIFKKKLVDFPCPSFREIQESLTLGGDSAELKDRLCKSCPMYDKCYYPNQYKQVMESKYKVVIMQHTHFQCQEVLFKILQKGFDLMFVDESFIDSVYTTVRADEVELKILDKAGYEWTSRLASYLRGEVQAGKHLVPTLDEFKKVAKVFDDKQIPYRIPDFLRLYNQKRPVNKVTGIEVAYELPQVPVRVLTDATPPIRLLSKLTGIDNFKTFGEGEVLDVKRVHPENEIIQILNSSASVTSLEDGNKLELILYKIAELVEMEYTEHKVLITAYKRHFDRIEKFFGDHLLEFPTAYSRITIDCMSKGINKYAEYDVQFLLAGVYFTGKQYEELSYTYKTVANYYNHKLGRAQISNIFPADISDNCSTDIHAMNLTRIESGGDIVQYDNFKNYIPTDTWHEMIYEYNVSNTQQSIRLRFTPKKPRRVYILHNMPLPSTVITKSILLEDFIKPL